MKKFLLCLLVAVMVFSVAASAVAFEAGEGFYRYKDNEGANEETGIQVPTEIISQGDNFIEVKTGGYYDGKNIDGGVYTTEKVALDGLKVTVDFEEVPAASRDCWFTISFLNNTQAFDVGNFAEHGGYVTLIRYNGPGIEAYGYDSFGNPFHSANDQTFALQAGTKLVCDVYYDMGQLMVKYTNGDNSYTMPADAMAGLDVKFPEPEAYVFVSGNNVAEASDWKYKVTVEEGTVYDDEILAKKEFDKSKAPAAESIEQAASRIEEAKVAAEEALNAKVVPEEDKATVDAYLAEFDTIAAKIEEAKTALKDATTPEEVDAAIAIATAAAGEADTASGTLVAFVGAFEDKAPEADEPKDDDTNNNTNTPAPTNDGADEPVEKEDSSTMWIIIAVVVVVVIVAAVVISKKKKD